MDISPLVRRLIELQQELSESDRRFAVRLGIDWSYWSYVRRGERAAGRKLIEGACQAFPEVRSLIGVGLSSPNDEVSESPHQPVEAVS